MSTSRQYELVYIVTPEATDQEIADLHTQIGQIVERFGGTFDKTENWGRKRLAYDIGHHREGNYVVETITGSGELMKEIDRRLRVIDQVIRHLVVRVDEELRVPAVIPILSPVLTVIPLQLLAYHVAVARGSDVDKPRNLAKSVTVE